MKNPNTGQKRNDNMKSLKRNIAILLIPALMLTTAASFSQDELREEIAVHVDRNYYLPGEEIYFAVYCTEAGSGLPSRISVLANVELMNRQGELLLRKKLRLANGTGSGSMYIPMDLNSGEYMIRSYTSWMENFGPGTFHYTPLLIIHPSKKYIPVDEAAAHIDSLQYLKEEGTGKGSGIRIQGLEKTYDPRDSIVFTLEPIFDSGVPQTTTLSLSIARSESQYPFTPEIPDDRFEKAHLKSGWDDLKYMPDMKGIQLSGTLTRPGSGEAVANANVLLSFIDSITEIYELMSDRNGRFHFDLNGMHGMKDMIIQVPGNNQNILISIDPDRTMEMIPDYAWVSLHKSSLAGLFREMLLEQQLTAAYDLSPDRPDSPIPGPSLGNEHLPFYGEPDHQIIMEDFVNLPVMEEVFRELGKRVFLSREEGKYKARLLDVETNRIIGDHPFYFIDGVPFFDSEKLLDLDPSLIKSISLKSRRYFMGDLVMDGIIDIKSQKGDAGLIDFPRSAVREYFLGFPEDHLPVSETFSGSDRRIPLYKTTLYFKSSIETGKGKTACIKLIAPDSKGSYTIAILGISTDGIPIEENFSFHVH